MQKVCAFSESDGFRKLFVGQTNRTTQCGKFAHDAYDAIGVPKQSVPRHELADDQPREFADHATGGRTCDPRLRRVNVCEHPQTLQPLAMRAT